ncbi:MAG: phage tail assembly protein [Clostridiales bacterium]|nr:phage tail assembly protein [Eubacterium sp.]MDD7349749.1 phage tail assembly protein [Clostridiales bacterium]
MNNKLKVKFRKPFNFEGKEYTEVDLSGLEKLTGRDMEEIEKTLSRENLDTINGELTLRGTMLYASRATGRPIEFFQALPAVDCRRIKNTVINFFMMAI